MTALPRVATHRRHVRRGVHPQQVSVARGAGLGHTAARRLESLHDRCHRLRALRPLWMTGRGKVIEKARGMED